MVNLIVETMIYLVTCDETNTCKIGFSNNPEKRLAQLQTGNPFPLQIKAIIEGDIALEKQLHKKFSHLSQSGEWFVYDDEIKDYFQVDEVWLASKLFMTAIGTDMTTAEINVFAYLMEHYSRPTPFIIHDHVKLKICQETTLEHPREVDMALVLLQHKPIPMIYKTNTGRYVINPRYVFKGSVTKRNEALQKIIELGCKDC